MDVADIFRTKGRQLFWQRLDDQHVHEQPTGEAIESNAAYVTLRLAEMYLGKTRVLWRKRSPLLHTYVKSGTAQELHAVAGPGELQDLGERNLDRVLVLNYRLAGPLPYRGDELSLLSGLYAVPREDSAAALVGTVGALAGLVGAGGQAGVDVAKVVKMGVESILGLGQTELRLGVNDTFSAGNPLRSGFLVGIGAPSDQVDAGRLWLDGGRLKMGSAVGLAKPYQEHDYFVIQVERLERRPDWSGLPGLERHAGTFTGILAGGQDEAGKRAALRAAWPAFREALVTSPYLTTHDAEEIAKDVAADLKGRLAAIVDENPFEIRAIGGLPVARVEPRDVDFALVGDRDPVDDKSLLEFLPLG
jgi:hypothetical protein